MKNSIITILFVLGFISCKAQNPVIDIYNPGYSIGDVDNTYYKDTQNFRDQFVGTWVYTNGNITLKVVFQKRDQVAFYDPSYYEDLLIGEFQYVENGIEKVNTLVNLNTVNVDESSIFNFSLLSVSKLTNIHYGCEDCPPGTERLSMRFDEPANDDVALSADFDMRRVVEGGIEKLKINFYITALALNMNKANWDLPSTAREHTIPYGEYTLIKVEE